jgi:hypothetical protein
MCDLFSVDALRPINGVNDMATKKTGEAGRLAKGAELEVQHLAETTDLSPKQARELLKRHGNDWEKIRREAETFKAEG